MLQIWIDREQLVKNRVDGTKHPVIVVHDTTTNKRQMFHEVDLRRVTGRVVQSLTGEGVQGTQSTVWIEVNDLTARNVTGIIKETSEYD